MGKMLANKFDGMSFRTRIGLVFMLLLGVILYQAVIGPMISDSATNTYYFTTASSVNVGVDGSTQTTASRGGKIAMTTGTYNSSRYVSAASNTNWQVLTNVYGPAYATSQTVSAPELTIGTRDFNGTSNPIYWKADVYDYNPAGTAGNGILLWSTTGEDEAHSFAASAKQLTFTSTAATPIVAGHRLKVVISARMTSTNSSARLYWGSSTNYSFLKVTAADTAANTVTVTNLNDYNGGSLTSVLQGEQNVAMLQFHLYSNAATEWTGGKLDKIGSNTVLNDATFYIYQDANDNDAFDSVSDTNIGGPYNFSQATGAGYTLAVPQTLDATPRHYFVVFTIDGNATTLTTIGSRIQNNSYFTVTNGLSVSTITSTSSSLPTINSVGSAVNKNYSTDWDSGTALLLPENGGESVTDSPCITTSVTNPIGTNLIGLLNFPSHTCTSVSGRTNRSSEANPNFVTLYFNGISGYPNNMITVKGVSLKFRTRGTGQFAVQLFYVKPDGTRVNSPVTSTVNSSGTTTVLRTLTLAGQTFTNVPAGSRLGVRIGVSASGMGVGLGGADATQLAMQETAGINTNVNIGNGSAIADGNVTASSTDNVVNSFTLAAVSGNQTVNSVTVTGNSATNSSNVALVKLYADKGTVGALDGNDTLLGSTAMSGNSATINVNEVVGATSKRYLLTYDITAAPTTGSVLNGTVTGLGGVTPGNNTDAFSAKLTVVATTTVTNGSSEPASVPVPSGGSATNIDAFGLNINGGSNDSISTVSVALLPSGISARIARVEIVDRISGTVYGSLTAPTSADDWRVSTSGLEATSATRECYVRITPKANIAAVYSTTALVTSISHSKTQNGVVINDSSSATVTLDGQAPSDPVLTATSGAAEGTIQLNWTTSSDSSGMHGTQAYTLVRGNVNAPAPVNCSSGTLVYQGSSLSILDSGSVGQSYSYRVCAKDVIGNSSPGTKSSAMAAVPTVCNTAPSISVNPVTSFVKPGQPVQMTVGLSNNDTGACSGTTFTLSLVGTENSADFTTPSVLGTNTFNLPANGGGASTTLTITAKAGAPQNSTNTFTVRASAAGHPSADTAAPVMVTVNDFGTMIHSSLQLGTQRFGSWGVNYNCETCHSPEGGNIKQVRDVITTPQGDRPVVFSTVSAAHTVTTGVFGNDTKSETHSTNVCSVCHHNTRFHQYSASKVAWKEHNNGADCIRCHPHNKGFKGEGVVASCDECHGNPPVSAATMASPATNALYPFATNAGAHGKHNPHMNCLTCHNNSNHSGSPTPTGNTNLEMGFSISAANFPGFNGSIESGQFTGSNTLNTQYHWSAGPGTTLLQASNTTTCSVYCHGWPGSGGSNSTPSWIGAEQKGCGTCHDATGANPPQSGSHIKHTGTTIGNNGIACVKCHGTYSNYSTSISHTNGIVEWNLSQISGIATYKGANSGNTGTPAPSGSYGSCSNLYCHSNVQSANGTAGPTFYDNPSWGGSTNCNNCHPGNPNTTAGHPQHVSDANTSFDCRICHGSGGDANPLNHANGQIDFDFSGLGANTVYSKGAYKTPGTGGFGSCSNSDCHGRQNISWAAASPLPLCDKCHGSSDTASFYGTGGPASTTSNTDPQVGAHTLHIKNAPYAYSSPLDCGECHMKPAGPYSPGHIDNALPGEIQFGAIAARGVLSGYSSLPSYNAGRECNNTWCHGAGMDSSTGKGAYAAVLEDGGTLAVPATPVWNVPYLNGNANNDCSRCHGYPPSAPGPGYNHYLKTAVNCIECHKHVNAAGDGFTNASLHVNGTVDSCNTCHGRPPIDMAGLTVPALNAMRPEQVGAHNAHLLNPNIGGDCAVCHNNYTSTMPSNAMEMGFNAYAGRVSGGTFWGYSTLTNNVYVSSSAGTTVRRTNDETKQNTCTNLYCHGGGTPLGNAMNTQPNWELGSGEASCGSCHGVSAVTPPTLGSHIKHASASGLALSCDTCHGIIENNYHVNGSVEWDFYTSARVGINATYTPAVGSAGHNGGTNALAPSSSYGSCSMVYCHSDGKGAYKTIQWGSAGPLGCGSCHNDQTTNPTMSHAKHITTYGIACGICHNGAGSGTEKHVDGMIDVIFNTGVVGASAQYDSGTKNCFSIVCHVSTASTGPAWGNAVSGTTTYPATCIGCHSGTINNRSAVVPQFAGASHHVQGVSLSNSHCYQCHREAADSSGTIDAAYHDKTTGKPVDLMVWSAGARGTAFTRYTAAGSNTPARKRAEYNKINNHCLGCHNAATAAAQPFGDGKTPVEYSWEKIKYGTAQSIAAKYSDTTTTLWGKFTGNHTNSKNSQTKAYSGHGNAAANQRGWSTLAENAQSTTTVANYPNTSGAVNVLCYDCHNSHGSDASAPAGAITTSYSSATGRGKGGILKNTVTNKGGYTVAYRPYSGGNAAQKNVYKAGAGICFDCHNNSAAGAATSAGNNSPWGYGTFGATQLLHGYNDNPYFGKTGGAFAKGVTYPYIGTGLPTNKGGHFGKSSAMLSTPTGQIGGLCTPCHDPHGVSPGIASADRQYAVPMLKGTYVTSFYKQDAAAVNTAHGGGDNVSQLANAATAGYHIDQNTLQVATTGRPITALRWNFATAASTLATLSDTQFAGLCMNCHNKADINSTVAAVATGTTDGAWKNMKRIHNSVDGWALTTGTAGNVNNKVHAYTCSKCHSPHNSNLPRLLVTNCLDATHKNRVATGGATTIGPFSGSTSSGNGLGRFPGGGGAAATGDRATAPGPWFFGTSGSAATQTCHDTATAGGTTFNQTSQQWNTKSLW